MRECWAPMDDDYQWLPRSEIKRGPWKNIAYRADGTMYSGDGDPVGPPFWMPSIHMPRWAARTWLRIIGVRVERVDQISRPDALAEGYPNDPIFVTMPIAAFGDAWNALYAAKGLGMDDSPWVWVVSFEKAEAPNG